MMNSKISRLAGVGCLCTCLLVAAWSQRRSSSAAATASAESTDHVVRASQFDSLQRAIDSIPSTGGVLLLDFQRRRITEPLVLSRSDVSLVGSGAATCIVNANQEGQPALIVRPDETAENPGARLWRVRLSDFRICGDPEAVDAKSTEPRSGDGVQARGINEIFIHGLSVDHCGGSGVHLIDCYEDPRVSDSIFTYNRQAGLNIQGGHDIVVSANQFEENQDAVRCIDSFNLCMSGNNLDDHLRHGVVIENTYGSVLSGNMIEECQGTAIILDRDCYGITISANVLADNFGGGVDLRDAWGCAVSANTFTIDAVRALVIGPQSGRITVTGNNFADSYIGAMTRRSGKPNLATGIILEGTTDIAISGNGFSGLNGAAIQADSACRRLAITGNVITEVQTSTQGRQSALEVGTSIGTAIGLNVISKGEDSTPEAGRDPRPSN